MFTINEIFCQFRKVLQWFQIVSKRNKFDRMWNNTHNRVKSVWKSIISNYCICVQFINESCRLESVPIKVLRQCLLERAWSLTKYYDGGKGRRIYVPEPHAVFPIFGKVSISWEGVIYINIPLYHFRGSQVSIFAVGHYRHLAWIIFYSSLCLTQCGGEDLEHASWKFGR